MTYLSQCNNSHSKHYFSYACSTDLVDTLVVTGGMATGQVGESRVQVYTTAGVGERLPDMNTARMSHACGHFIKDEKVVTTYLFRDISSTSMLQITIFSISLA